MTDQVPSAEPEKSTAEAPASLGRAAGRGFSWLSLTLVFGKVLSFLAQIVLGAILLDEEFGVYAIAASIAIFVRVFNDGGAAQILIQRGKEQFPRLMGPCFWIGMCFSLATGLFLAAFAPFLARLYQEPQLVPMLLIFAVTMPLGAPATIFKAKLRMDLRFRTIAWIGIVWFLIRHLGVILLAYLGYGAMSFVIPLPFVSVFEVFATFVATRILPWKRKIQFSQWPEILGSSFWVVAAALFRGLARNGDYVVLGLLVSKAIVGQYFFGYQLTVSFAVMMAANIQYVLFPVMSQMANEPARQAKAIVRTIRLMVLVAAPFSLIIAAMIGSLEAIVWNEKWAMVVPLMQIFSVAAPIRLIPEIVHAAMTSRGQFRKSAVLVLAEGLLLMLSAWLAVELFGPNITQIALLVASAQVAFSIAVTLAILHRYGLRPGEVLGAFLPAWLTSTAVAAITIAVSNWFLSETPLLVRFVTEVSLFSGLFLVLARSLFSNQLEDLASVVPRPLDGWVRKVLFLNSAASSL